MGNPVVDKPTYYTSNDLYSIRPYQGEDKSSLILSQEDQRLEILEGGFIAQNLDFPQLEFYISEDKISKYQKFID